MGGEERRKKSHDLEFRVWGLADVFEE